MDALPADLVPRDLLVRQARERRAPRSSSPERWPRSISGSARTCSSPTKGRPSDSRRRAGPPRNRGWPIAPGPSISSGTTRGREDKPDHPFHYPPRGPSCGRAQPVHVAGLRPLRILGQREARRTCPARWLFGKTLVDAHRSWAFSISRKAQRPRGPGPRAQPRGPSRRPLRPRLHLPRPAISSKGYDTGTSTGRSFPDESNDPRSRFGHRLAALALPAARLEAAQAEPAIPAAGAGEPRIILTPKPGPAPRINGARVFGVRPGSPFLFTIPATGERPMTFAVDDLPDGPDGRPEDRPNHRRARRRRASTSVTFTRGQPPRHGRARRSRSSAATRWP